MTARRRCAVRAGTKAVARRRADGGRPVVARAGSLRILRFVQYFHTNLAQPIIVTVAMKYHAHMI